MKDSFKEELDSSYYKNTKKGNKKNVNFKSNPYLLAQNVSGENKGKNHSHDDEKNSHHHESEDKSEHSNEENKNHLKEIKF